jgi:hypothetical protein
LVNDFIGSFPRNGRCFTKNGPTTDKDLGRQAFIVDG